MVFRKTMSSVARQVHRDDELGLQEEYLSQQRGRRLLNFFFTAWESIALHRAYERQRRLVAAETMLRIIEIRKALKFWFSLAASMAQDGEKKALTSALMLRHGIKRWRQSVVDAENCTFFVPLEGGLRRISLALKPRENNSRKGGTSLTLDHFPLDYSLALGLCGLIHFIAAGWVTNVETLRGIHHLNRETPATFLSLIRLMYMSKYTTLSTLERSSLCALDFLYAMWPVHHGRLWTRHPSIAVLFRLAILKVHVISWCRMTQKSKQIKKSQKIHCLVVWIRSIVEKRRISLVLTRQEQRLNVLVANKLLFQYWKCWRLMTLEQFQINTRIMEGVLLHGRHRIKTALVFWKASWEQMKSLRVREEFLQRKWRILVALWDWRRFISDQHNLIKRYRRCLVTVQEHCLKKSWRILRFLFREAVQTRSAQITVRHRGIRHVLSVWHGYLEERFFSAKVMAFVVQRDVHTALREWIRLTLYSSRVTSHFFLHRQRSVKESLVLWRSMAELQSDLGIKKKRVTHLVSISLLNICFTHLKRFGCYRLAARQGCQILRRVLFLRPGMHRFCQSLDQDVQRETRIYVVLMKVQQRQVIGRWLWVKQCHQTSRTLQRLQHGYIKHRCLVNCQQTLMLWRTLHKYKTALRSRHMLGLMSLFHWGVFFNTVLSAPKVQVSRVGVDKAQGKVTHVNKEGSVFVGYHEGVFSGVCDDSVLLDTCLAVFHQLDVPLRQCLQSRGLRCHTQVVEAVHVWLRHVQVCQREQEWRRQRISLTLRHWIRFLTDREKALWIEKRCHSIHVLHWFKTWKWMCCLKLHYASSCRYVESTLAHHRLGHYWRLWTLYAMKQKELFLRAETFRHDFFKRDVQSCVLIWHRYAKYISQAKVKQEYLQRKSSWRLAKASYLSWERIKKQRDSCRHLCRWTLQCLLVQKILPAWKAHARQERFLRKQVASCQTRYVFGQVSKALQWWRHQAQRQGQLGEWQLRRSTRLQRTIFIRMKNAVETYATATQQWMRHRGLVLFHSWAVRNRFFRLCFEAILEKQRRERLKFYFSSVWIGTTRFLILLRLRLSFFLMTIPSFTPSLTLSMKNSFPSSHEALRHSLKSKSVYPGRLVRLPERSPDTLSLTLELNQDDGSITSTLACCLPRQTCLLFLDGPLATGDFSSLLFLNSSSSSYITTLPYIELIDHHYQIRTLQREIVQWAMWTKLRRCFKTQSTHCFHMLTWILSRHQQALIWRRFSTLVENRTHQRHILGRQLENLLQTKILTRHWECWKCHFFSRVFQLENDATTVYLQLAQRREQSSLPLNALELQQTIFSKWLLLTQIFQDLTLVFSQNRMFNALHDWNRWAATRRRLFQCVNRRSLQRAFQQWHRTSHCHQGAQYLVKSIHLIFRKTTHVRGCLLRWHHHSLFEKILHKKKQDVIFCFKQYSLLKLRSTTLTQLHQKRCGLRLLHEMQTRVLMALQRRLANVRLSSLTHRSLEKRYWTHWRRMFVFYEEKKTYVAVGFSHSMKKSTLGHWIRFTQAQRWIQSVQDTTLAGIFQCWKYKTLVRTRYRLYRSIQTQRGLLEFVAVSRHLILTRYIQQHLQMKRLQHGLKSFHQCLQDQHLKTLQGHHLEQKTNYQRLSLAFRHMKMAYQLSRQRKYQDLALRLITPVSTHSSTTPWTSIMRLCGLHIKQDTFTTFHSFYDATQRLFLQRLRHFLQRWSLITEHHQKEKKKRHQRILQAWKQWRVFTLMKRHLSGWIKREERIRIIHVFLLYRHVFMAWTTYVGMRQPLRVLRRQKTENLLRQSLIQWRLLLRYERCRKLRVAPYVLNGFKLNGFLDHSWSGFISTDQLRHIAFESWLLRTYRMSWERECKKRQVAFYQKKCFTEVMHLIRYWHALTRLHKKRS